MQRNQQSSNTILLLCFCWLAPYILQAMTLEDKVGQLLMVHFHGETANNNAKILIQETKVGGIIYYNWANGLHSPAQVQNLSSELQKLAKENPDAIPLLIAADQEGGICSRLTHGFTVFPGNKALGVAGDLNLAEEAALAMGEELRVVGVNMNLAPVVDINTNPKNPIIGVRSFGDDTETVLAFGACSLQGYQKANVITTLKHFPGHGDVSVDSHEDMPVIHKTMTEMERMELFPFAQLSANADAIMTAHILVPAFDTENCSTLSHATLSYLRNQIGFNGVIISDSLVMSGVLKKCQTVDEAAIQALNAGCDILLLGGKLFSGELTGFELSCSDIQRVHRSIVKAVNDGRIQESRVNDAVAKILKLKEKCLRSPIANAQDLDSHMNTTKHRMVAQKIASLALKATRNSPLEISNLQTKKVAVIAPQILHEAVIQTSLTTIGKTTEPVFYRELNPTSDEIEGIKEKVNAAEVLIVCSYNAWKNPAQASFIKTLIDTGKPVILIVTRDSLDTALFSNTAATLTTYSPTYVSIQAACNSISEGYTP